ncbi:G- coupled receptor GRL101-like, partial [Paramuricea clavata]
DKVRVENIESLKTIKLEVENDDCLICYELPSKQTLDVFLKLNNQEIAEEKVYYILNGLIRAIHYLSSKKVVLRSVLPENIILVESPQLGVVTTVLGGLHKAKFVSSSSEEGNELSEENLKELEVNVMTFGNMTKMLLAVCPALDKYQELVDIMVSCLSDCKPTASDLVEQLALMDR